MINHDFHQSQPMESYGILSFIITEVSDPKNGCVI